MAAVSEIAPKTDAIGYVLDGIDQERTGRIQAVYALWEIYRLLPDDPGLPGKPGPRESLLNDVGSKRNIAPSRLEDWLTVPERIPYEPLMDAFPPTSDGEPSWHLTLSWTHFETAAKVGGKVADRHGPQERIRWLVLVADNEWSTADFDNWLHQQKLIEPRTRKTFQTPEDDAKDAERVNKGREAAAYLQKCLAGEYGPDVKKKIAKSWSKRESVLSNTSNTPNTAVSLLRAIADSLETQDKDLDLSARLERRPAGQPIDIGAFLGWLSGEYKRVHPGVEFKFEEAKP